MALPRRKDARRRRCDHAGFNFTFHMRRLCGDMVARVPELRHIELDRVAISFCQARKSVQYGMYASLTPMRFAGGRMQTVRRGRKWGVQRLLDDTGREMLYILSFYLPRFLQLGPHEKLSTVMHELWHIGPRFDGDVRRFGGRCYAHTPSQRQYDAQVEKLVNRWLSLNPPETVCGIIHDNFQQLVARYGGVYGQKIPTPKLFPVD